MPLKYHSQFEQDKFLDLVIFNEKENGFFIDIGAHDGVTISNTLFFERNRKWSGFCIEPNPSVFHKLQKNRQSENLNVCIGNDNRVVKFTKIEGYSEMLSGLSDYYDHRHVDRINGEIAEKGGSKSEIEVSMVKLDSIERLRGRNVDFMSIDTEGNEFDILQSINFDAIDISALVVENNYNDHRIRKLLENHGYRLVYKLHCDDVFLRKEKASFQLQLRALVWSVNSMFRKVARGQRAPAS